MPPPLASESDADSIVEEVLQTQTNDAESEVDEKMKDAAANAEEGEGEEEEDGEDGDEETYVVEQIISHHDNFADEVMRYEIKWKGYPKKADRTWETEENLDPLTNLPLHLHRGAREILEAYWLSIGGKPLPSSSKPPKSSIKKRGRQSTGSTAPAEPAKKQQKRGRKSAASASAQDRDNDTTDADVGPVGYTDVNPDSWKPPAPNDNAWDPLVMNVDTIEKDDKEQLWAYLVWNEKNDDGRFNRSKAKLATCNKACPQRMLQFYEKHVVFTNNKNNYVEENGAAA
ncbi:MAG: hypothetical protein Q9222_004821 [Ikaeria aurantiellina]